MLTIAHFDDLHTEFGAWKAPQLDDVDVITFGGDIATTPEAYAAIVSRVLAANPRVQAVGVLGNHEFYGNDFFDGRIAYRETLSGIPRFTLLDDAETTINGVRFIGATMWTDLSDPDLAFIAEKLMNDYRMIAVRGRRFRATDTTSAHVASVRFLREALVGQDNARTVVLTHHAPMWRCIAPTNPRYREAVPMYCAHMDRLIEETQPAAWLHGHIHDLVRLIVGRTVIANNPRDYVRHDGTGGNRLFESAGYRLSV